MLFLPGLLLATIMKLSRRRQWHPTPVHFCLENPMDRGAWWAAVHGVAKSRTPLSDCTFTFHFPALEKEMATHSRVLAWRIPGTGEAWWAVIYGVAQSRTRLKRLSSSSSSSVYIYMPMLISQFFPPSSSPTPTVFTYLFSTSVSLFLPCK